MESIFITLNHLKHKPWVHKQAHSKAHNLAEDSSTEDWLYSTNIFTWKLPMVRMHLRWQRSKLFFSLDSAVCIRKPPLRWKGWKKQEGSLQLFKELSAVSSAYNVSSASLLWVPFMWWKAKYLKDDKWWTVNDNSDSEGEKAVYVWLWGKCNPMSLTH